MRLKSLELQGFKSFPDKTIITFDSGITVVVGPNGSGKSNIADAMRWVLGEMSSKNIRGGKMEDVVFAGSQKRSAMGYAEVSVTFDNSEENGKIASLAEYDEITVTRRYYRVGDSEYFINRKPVRLRDIHELFFNTGLGKDGYSIIGQGKIAEIISQKNEERRAIFEEAAGIAKYRFQKNEAERKLQNTEENLTRLEDIASVMGERVEPLEKESEKAKKYLDLRNEKMTLDIALSVFDIAAAKTITDELSGKVFLAKEELDEADDKHSVLETEEEKVRQSDLQNKIDTERHAAKILSLTTALHDHESALKLAENDKEHLQASILAAKERISSSEDNVKLAEKEASRFTKEYEEAQAQKDALSEEAALVSDIIQKTEREIAEQNAYAVSLEQTLSSLRNEQTNAHVEASVAAAKEDADRKRSSELSQAIAKLEGDLRLYDTRIQTAEAKISEYREKEAQIQEKIKHSEQERLQNEQEIKLQNEKKNSLFLEISQRRHKVQNLIRMEELLEGYSGSVRFLVKQHKEGKILLPSGQPITMYGPVSGLIRVPDAYSAALEIAFGQTLQNIIVEDEDSAQTAIAYLKKKNAGRATLYPISTMRGNEVNIREIPEEHRAGFIAVASTLVECDEKFRGIIKNLLGRILIATDIHTATKLAKAMNFRYRIVTLDGQVVNAGGSFTGGSLSPDGRMLSRRVQIDKLNEEIKTLDVQYQTTQQLLRELAEKQERQKKNEASLTASASGVKTLHDAEMTQLAMLSSARDTQKNTLSGMKQERSLLLLEAEQTKNRFGNMDKKRADFEEKLRQTEETLLSVRQTQNQYSEQAEAEKTKLSSLTIEIAKADARLSMLRQMTENSEKRMAELHHAIDALVTSVNESEEKKRALQKQMEESRKQMLSCQNALTLAEAEKVSLTEKNMETEKRLSELRIQIRNLSDKRDLLYRTYTKLESDHQAQREKQDKLIAFLWDEYEISYTEAIRRVTSPITSENRTAAITQQTKLKNQIKSLGNVNVNAIEEYKEVKKQFDELTSQIEDLHKSKESLTRIIDSLEDNMRRDFLATVEAINIHFGRVFAKLFGGGHAEIRLCDPQNILESGIDINVAPPGKVIKNMSLLSGGEQAFVAIALYFAILEVNPSPFCILDEIEAALDEVNVDKFADYVKQYADKTQFVIITHRRGTMEAAERLYGVTMHEKGISDVISINVSEIEQKIGVKFE